MNWMNSKLMHLIPLTPDGSSKLTKYEFFVGDYQNF